MVRKAGRQAGRQTDMYFTCVIRLEILPADAVGDVGNGDIGVQRGVVRRLRLIDVSAVAHGEDVGEAVNLHVVVDLQGAAAGHRAG